MYYCKQNKKIQMQYSYFNSKKMYKVNIPINALERRNKDLTITRRVHLVFFEAIVTFP